ncbi:MAG TPA: transposase [Streptosporangiaceae bacterium]
MATTAVASIEDAAECGVRADALVTGLLRRVMRQQRTVATALEYIGVLSKDTRANCWELALKAGHERPYRMQALLSRCAWSWEELRGLLPGLAQQVLPDNPDDLIGPGLAFDETADLRKGQSTACVAPQHAGSPGRWRTASPGCSRPWSPRSGRPGPTSTCTCPGAGRRIRRAGGRPGSRRRWRSPRSRTWRSRR